jgi:hypothetical protein
MELAEIAKIRLASQHIAGAKFNTPRQIARWMIAMQAQDYAMLKWALGVRLPGSTLKSIEQAINAGELLRTHLLRNTWHLASAEDIQWLLALRSPRIKASLNPRLVELELSEAVISKSHSVLEKCLRDGNHSSREELILALEKTDITTTQNRASHLFMLAELEGLICSGADKDGKPTYALLAERAPIRPVFSREEALAKLASGYFSSRGPASLKDFTWWSGLTATEAHLALELVKGSFDTQTIDGLQYWFLERELDPRPVAHFLPAFDELIISYTNRSAAIPKDYFRQAVYENGIFRPVIVVDGQVVGIWKRTLKKNKVIVETEFFDLSRVIEPTLIEKAALEYGRFLGKELEFKVKVPAHRSG